MAWRSSGSNNTEMVDKLKRFGVITSEHVEEGFRSVDRKFYVPLGNESMAHSDQPLKEGNVHISAPHIYGSALEALDLTPNSSISFLNVGSGTGYISCVAAQILGPNSLNYGVELHDDVIEHCKTSISKWKTNTVEVRNNVSVFQFSDDTADIQIIKGNGLHILNTKGESVVGFDRIYIGAAVDKEDLANITKLLCPGGILVGPVDDELVKVVRIGNISLEMEDDHMATDDDSSLTGLNGEFTSQILSGVRFAPLVMSPALSTVIPSNVWNPTIQQGYPSEFKLAACNLLMCSNSQLIQPLPAVPRQEERFNAAALLPKSIWLEILSYTHRKWFEPVQNETDYLKRRLREEKAKTAKAEKARREAEERCLAAERERAVYRLLARRWQSRLNTLLSQQERQDENARLQDEAAEELSDLLDLAGGAHGNEAVQGENQSTLSGLRSMLQQLSGNTNNGGDDNGSNNEANVAGDELMEEDEGRENQDQSDDEGDDDLLEFLEDEDGSESDDFASVAEEDSDDNSSVVMEDVDTTISKGERAVDQPRSVSMSSDDL
jgi:protein-L-isoaspartate O-methyltransferase